MDLRRHRELSDLSARTLSFPSGSVVARVVAGLVAAWLVLQSSVSASSLDTPERRWALVGVIALSVALAWLLPAMRRLLPRPGDVPLVLCAVLLVSYLCVPENDQIHRVATVVALVAIAEGVSRRRLPILALAVVASYVMWAGVFGATGRQSALVGTLVAWWPFVLGPLLVRWRPALARAGPWTMGAITAIAATAAAVVARTGALEPTIGPALIATAIAIAASLVVAAIVAAVSARP